MEDREQHAGEALAFGEHVSSIKSLTETRCAQAAIDIGTLPFARSLIATRRSAHPRHLFEPGPSAQELETLFSSAAAAPDHRMLVPWRFVVVPPEKRSVLADVFAQALVDRDPGAGMLQIASARQKAHRAPLLFVAVARLASPREGEVPDAERIVSLGCAIQNILLVAHSMHYGSALTSGRAMQSIQLRRLFELKPNEQAVCFVNIGTLAKPRSARIRPSTKMFVSTL